MIYGEVVRGKIGVSLMRPGSIEGIRKVERFEVGIQSEYFDYVVGPDVARARARREKSSDFGN